MQRFAAFLPRLFLLFAAASVSAASPPASLVIIGASYAADWQRPNLPGYSVVNRGVGGEETHQVRARFERDLIAAKPDAVLIWGHINNIHRAPGGDMNAAKERIKGDVRDMVAMARARGITVMLATEVTLSEAVGFGNRLAAFVGRIRGKTSYAAKINDQVRDVNAWLRGYAKQEGLRLLDFEKALDDGEGFRDTDYTRDDGSHISPEGYAALTAYTRAQLAAR
jgi:lysophospholipase L1-like esterase